MKMVLPILLLFVLAPPAIFAQRAPVQKTATAKPPQVVPIKEIIVDKGTVSGQVYTNETLNFSITFPNTWRIREDNFEDEMLKQGFDIRLKAPDNLSVADKAKVDRSLKGVEVLVTASRSLSYDVANAIIRISAEGIRANLQIKDAVDYFDAVRKMYSSMKLPPDFKYSETQAEKLGSRQFAFLDVSSNAGKKRMYATVRGGFAILFTVSYTSDDDLQAMRQILATGKFRLK